MKELNYKNVLNVNIDKDKIVGYGIDYLVFNIENLYTENQKITNLFKSKLKRISYNIKKQAGKVIKNLKQNNIEISMDIENIQDKLEKIFIAEYKGGTVDVDEIYNKISKAYNEALDGIENKKIKEEIKKIFIDKGSTIYFLKQLYNIIKNSIHYTIEVEETSKLFRIYIYRNGNKEENNIKIIGAEIYKKQNKYTGSLTFYGMCFRLMSKGYLEDIKDVIIEYILLKDSGTLQRIDLYIDYNGNLILKKREKGKDINYYKSRSTDGIEAETIVYNFKDGSKLRNYNSYEDKKNKNKLFLYDEYSKNTKRIEIELKFGRTGLYKIRNSKFGKILSSVKNGNLQLFYYFEYLFYSLFGYEIENVEEFGNRELVVQVQDLFYYTGKKMIEYKELKKEDNMNLDNAIKTTKGRLKKLYKNGITIKQIKEINKDIEIEIKQEKKVKEQSFMISYIKALQEIQEQKRKKDKELFYVENYKQEIADYYIYISEMLEEEQIYFADIQIQERAKKMRKEIQEQIQDSRELQKYITDIEKKLIQKRKNKNKEMFKKLGFLDYLQDTETQIKYIETTF